MNLNQPSGDNTIRHILLRKERGNKLNAQYNSDRDKRHVHERLNHEKIEALYHTPTDNTEGALKFCGLHRK